MRELVAFCRQHKVPHEICGKLVVATDESEVPRLRDLHKRGTKNGLEGLRFLNREQMREIEPHVSGVAGLHVPQEGIVDYAKVCEQCARRSKARADRSCWGRSHGARTQERRVANRHHCGRSGG